MHTTVLPLLSSHHPYHQHNLQEARSTAPAGSAPAGDPLGCVLPVPGLDRIVRRQQRTPWRMTPIDYTGTVARA